MIESLRDEMTIAAERVSDDEDRAWRAMVVAGRLRRRRLRRRFAATGTALACVVAGAWALPFLAVHGHRAAPPTSAAISCEPGRTVVLTPKVATLGDGAVVSIVNATPGSVVVRLGGETAVLAPGVAEGQYTLRPGRQLVQCVQQGRPTTAASLAVVAAHRA